MPHYAIKAGPADASKFLSDTMLTGGWLPVKLAKKTKTTMHFELPDGEIRYKHKAGIGTTWLEELGWPIFVHKEQGRPCIAVRATTKRLAYRYSVDDPFAVRGWVMLSFEGDTWLRIKEEVV